MQQALEVLGEYKAREQEEHIVSDDILNKITQEVVELLDGIAKQDEENIYEEAGDVLVNILSFARELGLDVDDLLCQGSESEGDLLQVFGLWNEQVQALRQRYTRKQANPSLTQSLTKSFIRSVLNYTNPEENLSDTLKNNLSKITQRKGMYKPEINPVDYIAQYPDFPKPGINFKDISPLIANLDAMRYVCHEMAEKCRGADKIVALDARGFIFAPIISEILGIPWVMCRKKGKLPGETVTQSYSLEYGEATIEIQKSAISQGENIAIVDDLLATAGTATAAAELVEKLGASVHNCAFVIRLDDPYLLSLEKRKSFEKYNYSAVVSYDD